MLIERKNAQYIPIKKVIPSLAVNQFDITGDAK